MTQPPRLSPDSLLAHEPFVRAVVRDLLRDEQHVQDVLQETWIRALHRCPREEGSLKGWLARVARRLALDQHRGSARRERRERETARGEALESVEALHARLEAQREVVDAVLALEEPYKSVVLLAYYEELAPQAIAERLGRSAATVRSQLSRAHEILRRRLDAHHGGDRSAWAGVLVPWALATKSKTGLLVAAGIGVALIGAGVWVLPRMLAQRPAQPPAVALQLPVDSAPQPLAEPEPGTARASVAALVAAQPAAALEKPDLARLGQSELRDLAVQAMRTLEKKLTTPDARFFEEQRALLALPDTGLTKLIGRREDGSFPYGGMVLSRLGASYFSFATLSHDYDREPDLEYSAGRRLSGGFYGLAFGVIHPLGSATLEDLSAEQRVGPEELRVRPLAFDEVTLRPLQHRIGERRLSDAQAQTGVTYLVRSLSPGEHDQLVGIRVLEATDDDVTIAWRVLQRFPTPGERSTPHRKPEFRAVAEAPAWMQPLTVSQLVELIHEVRSVARNVLPKVPEALQQENRWRLSDATTSGFFRASYDENLTPLLESRNEMACYSCDRRAYPDQDWEIAVRNSGEIQALLQFDLGELDRATYESAARGELPADLGTMRSDSVDYARPAATRMLWSALTVPGPDGTARVLSEEAERADPARQLLQCAVARTGHSYLVRALGRTDGSDHLLLVSVLETSKDGTSFSWRELQRFDR